MSGRALAKDAHQPAAIRELCEQRVRLLLYRAVEENPIVRTLRRKAVAQPRRDDFDIRDTAEVLCSGRRQTPVLLEPDDLYVSGQKVLRADGRW